MIMLGINSAYHESSACLVVDGEVVAAAEEERFTRRKHAKEAAVDNGGELPLRAIEYCTRAQGITLGDVDEIGFSFLPERRWQPYQRGEVPADHVRDGNWGSVAGERRFFDSLGRVPEALRGLGFGGAFQWLDHHRCHAASAFLPSPFNDAAVLCLDGIGELAGVSSWQGRGATLTPLASQPYPSSLGFLWERLCTFLGFAEYDACKVMGLASYGDRERYRRVLGELVALGPDGSFALRNDVLRFRAPDDAVLATALGVAPRRLGEPVRHADMDLAAALQEVTTQVVLHVARELHRKSGATELCMAGGVALNCVTNTRLIEEGPFTDLYIPSAPHDAGTALGAALLLAAAKGAPRRPLAHAYLGPDGDEAAAIAELERRGLAFTRPGALAATVAKRIADGQIVAWFQGRMELGPRALGNRSLLADPRRREMREIMNHKVKHRESFRPFAPSVLAELAADWFVLPRSSRAAELMLLAVAARHPRQERIPAVVHVDGSSRIHLVRQELNPRYHALISAFYALTEVPMLLNTSFNDDEPIICTARDAIDTFLRTHIDCLVLGDLLVEQPARLQ